MRILHFSSAKTWRGGEQQIIYLVEALQKQGIQQWIFCRKNSALAEYCFFHRLPYMTYWKGFSINPSIGFQLKNWCTKLDIDLVHIHDSHSHTFAYMSALVGNKTPYVLSRRVDFRVKNNQLSHQKYNHPSIKKILSVSQKVQDVLAPAIKDASKLTVVHSGIDLSKFKYTNTHILRKELQLPTTTKIIANVAAIAPHKDYFTFVDTAICLLKKRKDLKFLMIGGDGGEADKIQAYIKEKEVSPYFVQLGFRKDIPAILPEVDVFLFTSKEEGLGTSLLDALACGVPIVATAAGGIPEIIQHQKHGLLAPVGAAEQLAKHVEFLLDQPAKVKELIKEGKEKVKLFSKESTARKIRNVYEEIISYKL